MEHDVMPSIVRMEPQVLRELVKEVRETVATDLPRIQVKQTSFGIADLWSIRRNAKTYRDFLNR